jgi:hypothetical protein
VGASGRETCAMATRPTSKAKGDTCYGGASPFYFTCTKKTVNRIFLPFPTSPCASVTHGHPCHDIQTEEEVENGENKLLEIFGQVVSRGFKSW